MPSVVLPLAMAAIAAALIAFGASPLIDRGLLSGWGPDQHGSSRSPGGPGSARPCPTTPRPVAG
jgi:hypothetical protein